MRYLLGVAAAVALIVGAGSAGAAVMKPAGLAQAAVDLGSLELVKRGRGHGATFCVACPIPMPLMNKNCSGSAQSCMAANPLCYVTAGACAAKPAAAAPAKAKKGKKAKAKGKGKAKADGKAKAKAEAKPKAEGKAKEKKEKKK